jgi:2-keto-4-pentenoate hydratase/2-oxohepta-3-ene-1,7-dioic acid hydratase in catechol pathway
MRFLSFVSDGGPALGLRAGDGIVNLTALGLPATLDELLRHGPEGLEAARLAATKARKHVDPASLEWLSPLQAPGKAVAVGLNYVDHAAESKLATTGYPVLFTRYATSWVPHGTPLQRPRGCKQFDYEGELVAIIGKAGRHIEKSRALEHVAGYSVFNDGSVREHQLATSQWTIGKNFDRTGSFGPEFVTADELPAGAAGLRLQTRLNDRVMQDANTRDMIFDVATLVVTCSEAFELQPGDIIITGTPAGVGLARKPQVFMEPGDVCDVEIEGVGLLSNPVVE